WAAAPSTRWRPFRSSTSLRSLSASPSRCASEFVSMNKLVVEDLHLQYGDTPILKGVSMTLSPGEVVALLGASGSGKTTLLRSGAGLEQPSQGKIAIGDSVLFDSAAGIDMPVEQRSLGLVFQSYALWPHKTVFENVAYGLRLRNTSGADID